MMTIPSLSTRCFILLIEEWGSLNIWIHLYLAEIFKELCMNPLLESKSKMNLYSVSAAGRLAAIKKTAMAYSVQGIRYKWQFHIWRVSFVTGDGMECHAIAFPSFLTSHRITRVKNQI
jgi:hypothetical protein